MLSALSTASRASARIASRSPEKAAILSISFSAWAIIFIPLSGSLQPSSLAILSREATCSIPEVCSLNASTLDSVCSSSLPNSVRASWSSSLASKSGIMVKQEAANTTAHRTKSSLSETRTANAKARPAILVIPLHLLVEMLPTNCALVNHHRNPAISASIRVAIALSSGP